MEYKLIRDVTPKECYWLEKTYEAGTAVYLYRGVTYGAIGSGLPFTEKPDETPFFELPEDAVEKIDGQLTIAKALAKACIAYAEFTGSCPLDMHDKDMDCMSKCDDNAPGMCWQKYFLGEVKQ